MEEVLATAERPGVADLKNVEATPLESIQMVAAKVGTVHPWKQLMGIWRAAARNLMGPWGVVVVVFEVGPATGKIGVLVAVLGGLLKEVVLIVQQIAFEMKETALVIEEMVPVKE